MGEFVGQTADLDPQALMQPYETQTDDTGTMDWSAQIPLEPEHSGVEALQRLHLLVVGVDAEAGVVDFENLDCHCLISLFSAILSP